MMFTKVLGLCLALTVVGGNASLLPLYQVILKTGEMYTDKYDNWVLGMQAKMNEFGERIKGSNVTKPFLEEWERRMSLWNEFKDMVLAGNNLDDMEGALPAEAIGEETGGDINLTDDPQEIAEESRLTEDPLAVVPMKNTQIPIGEIRVKRSMRRKIYRGFNRAGRYMMGRGPKGRRRGPWNSVRAWRRNEPGLSPAKLDKVSSVVTELKSVKTN